MSLYKHLLLPTDGSELSQACARTAIALARDQGAKITALFVMPDYSNIILYRADALVANSNAEFEREINAQADKALGFVENLARQEGVVCELQRITHASPYKAIIEQAKLNGCDLICMASHGRKGLSAILLGSETQRVLTHSDIPVLVHRIPRVAQ